MNFPQLNGNEGDSVEGRDSLEMEPMTSWWSVGSLFGGKSKSLKKQRSSRSLDSGKRYDSAAEAMSSYLPVNKLSVGSEDTPGPEILLSMIYDGQNSSLTVTVVCLQNLPAKYDNQRVYVKIILQPSNHQKQETQLADGSNPHFHECFYFANIKISDLVLHHLTITAHKLHGHKTIGESFLNLGLLDINDGQSKYYWFPLLNNPRSRRVR